MERQEIISKFVTDLERFFEESKINIETLQNNIDEYKYIEGLIEVLQKSKYAFVEGVHSLNSERLQEFQKIVSKVITSKENLDRMYSETYNLFQLQQSGLINYTELAPQIHSSVSEIEKFEQQLIAYIKTVDINNLEQDKNKMEDYSNRILNLGNKFLSGEIIDDINDIPFFYEMLEHSTLTDEEKILLIEYALYKNIEIYNQKLSSKEDELILSLEESKNDVLEKINNSNEDSLSKEDKETINRLLENKELRTKLISITDDEYSEIESHEDIPEAIEKELIAIIKEEIIRIMLDKEISVEEAINLYIEQTDYIRREAKEKLSSILSYQNDILLERKKITEVLNKAKEFVEENQKVLNNMTNADKEVQENYICELYNNLDSRVSLYKNKSYYSINAVKEDAVYEISYFVSLINKLDINNEEELILISKACQRIEEVFKSLTIVIEDTQKDFFEVDDDKEEKSTLFFLMKTKDRSFFENSVRFDSVSKGLSKSYYGEIKELLDKIAKHGNKLSNEVKGIWKNLHNFGVKCEYGSKVVIFYLIIDDDKILILDIFETRKMNVFREADERVRDNEDYIIEYIRKIKNRENNKEFIEEANLVSNRIINSFSNTDNTIDNMLNENEEPTNQSNNTKK